MRSQVVVATAVFALSAWLTITSVSYFGSRSLLRDTADQLQTIEQAYTDLLSESQLSTASFVEQIETLEKTAERQRETIRELTAIQHATDRQLESRERQIEAISAQRDHARSQIQDLAETIASARLLLHDKARIEQRLAAAESDLGDVSQQRDAGRRVEVGLRWQLARLENEVERLRNRRETEQVWLNDWVHGSVEALEQLFLQTGIDVERLVARAGGQELGQGGPLQVVEPAPAPSEASSGAGDPVSGNIKRLAALQRVARTLPLAPPLDHYYVTSTFGKRRDPFTKGWAFHAGLDFGAARGSEVLATAPGRVVAAGPSGAYGNMVEIDHGMGIVTRYGHMKKVSVQVGDVVDFRQPVGVIGSTGRSTARHLHYEVRVDDVAYDPARFLHAGRSLVDVFDISQSEALASGDGG